jgi:hypothetical protein
MDVSKRIVIIDTEIPGYDIFKNSLKDNCIVISYNKETHTLGDETEIYTIGSSYENITHLAFVYDFPGYYTIPFYPDLEYDTEFPELYPQSPYKHITRRLINIIQELKTRISPINLKIDLITCNLTDTEFQREIKELESYIGDIQIRYSVNYTGRSPTGDWILESHGVDIKEEYFTPEIDNWKYVLNSKIESNNLETIGEPGTFIKNGSTYQLTTNITWDTTLSGVTAITDYIELSDGEIFDGQGHTIIIPSSASLGLFSGASTIDTYAKRFKIRDLNIISNIGQSGGGFVRTEQKFGEVEGCKHRGRIGNSSVYFAGGIVGDRCGWLNGRFDLSNCHSYGDIGRACGGIVGDEFCMSGGLGHIFKCTSRGGNSFNQDAGGITGTYPAFQVGKVIIEDCWSTIGIGNNSGGITATRAGDTSGEVIVRRCSHQGEFSPDHPNGGGIIGGFPVNNRGYLEVDECFSVGKIYNAAGIVGASPAYVNGIMYIKNCYSLGNIISDNGSFGGAGIVGIRAGRSGGRVQIDNCYAAGVVLGNHNINLGGSITANNAGMEVGHVRIFNSYGSGGHRMVGSSSTTTLIKYNDVSLSTIGDTSAGDSMVEIVGEISYNSQFNTPVTNDVRLINTNISGFDIVNKWAESASETLRYCFHSVNKDVIVALPAYTAKAISFWICVPRNETSQEKILDLRTSSRLIDYDFFDSISGYEAGFSQLYVNGIEEPYVSPMPISYANLSRYNWAHVYLVLKMEKNITATFLGQYDNTQKTNGAIRDVVLWNRELTKEEIYRHYYEERGMISNLSDNRVAAYYTFNNTLAPSIGSNGNATATGTQHFSASYIGSGLPILLGFTESGVERGWTYGSYELPDDFPKIDNYRLYTGPEISNGIFEYYYPTKSFYRYKKPIYINRGKGAAPTNYPIYLQLRYGEGRDHNNVIYLDSSCHPTFKDIKFGGDAILRYNGNPNGGNQQGSEGQKYSYFIEEKIDGEYANVWVKATDKDLGENDSLIYLYYGNELEEGWKSSGDGTFTNSGRTSFGNYTFENFADTTFRDNPESTGWISGINDVGGQELEFLNITSSYGSDISLTIIENISGFIFKNTSQPGLITGTAGNYITIAEVKAYNTGDENVLQTLNVSGWSLSIYNNDPSVFGPQKAYDNQTDYSNFYHSLGTGEDEYLQIDFIDSNPTIKSFEVYERTDSSQFNHRSRYEPMEIYGTDGRIRFRKERTSKNVEVVNLGDYPSTLSLRTTNTSTGVVTGTNPNMYIQNNAVRYRTRETLRSRTATKVIVRANESENRGISWKKDRGTATRTHTQTIITSPFTGSPTTQSLTMTDLGNSPLWTIGEIACYDRYTHSPTQIRPYGLVDYLDTGGTPNLSGGVYFQNEKGPVVEFDWIAIRNYVPFEPEVVGTGEVAIYPYSPTITTRRKKISISPIPGAGDHYQVPLRIDYNNDGKLINLEGLSRTNFGDIRFVSSDGVTHLPFWFDHRTTGSHADVVVCVSESLSDISQDIYILYGDSTKKSTQNGEATYIFFDDFRGKRLESTKWTQQLDNSIPGNGSISISNSRVQIGVGDGTIPSNYGWSYIHTANTGIFGSNRAVRWRSTMDGASAQDVSILSHPGILNREKAYKARIMMDPVSVASETSTWFSGHKFALDMLGICDENLVFTTNDFIIIGQGSVFDFSLKGNDTFKLDINTGTTEGYPGMQTTFESIGVEDTGGISGGVGLHVSRGGNVIWDWVGIRKYVGEPATIHVDGDPEGISGYPPDIYPEENEGTSVTDAGPTRIYIPVRDTSMRELISVDGSAYTAYLNMTNLGEVISRCINLDIGTSDEISPEDISLGDYSIPIPLGTFLENVRQVMFEEMYNTALSGFFYNMFGTNEHIGNADIIAKGFLPTITEDDMLFKGSTIEAVSGDISYNLDTQNNLYTRLDNEGEISGNIFLGDKGYVIGVVIQIDGSGVIRLNYSDDSTSADGTPIPAYLRGIHSNTSISGEIVPVEAIMSSSIYPVGKLVYSLDSMGIMPDGEGGINLNVAIVSVGGSRGIEI